MRVLNRPGLRRIERIRLYQNTSRILNLIAFEDELSGQAPSGAAKTKSYLPRPSNRNVQRFFRNDALNHSIFLKHNLRDNEKSLFSNPRHVETKMLMPFDSYRLEFGARSFFIGEHSYHKLLKEVSRINPEAQDEDTRHDMKVLSLLRSLPSFDPFILGEALRMADIAVDRRYFSASYNQMKAATEAVYSDFKPLIESALGQRATTDQLARFIDDVWNVNDSTSTNLFFDTLGIPQSEWFDIIFAWKALLYYRLETKKFDKQVPAMISAIKKVQTNNNANMCDRSELRRLEHHLVQSLHQLQKRSLDYAETTSQALVAAISVDFNIDSFRTILRKLASKIVALGTDVTVFEQVVSYYLHLFGQDNCYVDGVVYETTVRSLDEIVSLRFAA